MGHHPVLDFPIKDLVFGIDPGRKSSGLVVLTLRPALGVVRAKRLPNARVCDLLWKTSVYCVYMEDYRLYPWMLGSLRWDPLKEVRLIGAVEEICRKRQIQLIKVSPSQSKALVDDQDLVKLGTWSRNAHVNDAFRVFWASTLGDLEGGSNNG